MHFEMGRRVYRGLLDFSFNRKIESGSTNFVGDNLRAPRWKICQTAGNKATRTVSLFSKKIAILISKEMCFMRVKRAMTIGLVCRNHGISPALFRSN